MTLYSKNGGVIAHGEKPIDSSSGKPCRQWKAHWEAYCHNGEMDWVASSDPEIVKDCTLKEPGLDNFKEYDCDAVSYGDKHDCIDVPSESDADPPGKVSDEAWIRKCCPPKKCLYFLTIEYDCDYEVWTGNEGVITSWSDLKVDYSLCVSESFINAMDAQGHIGKWKRQGKCKLWMQVVGDECDDENLCESRASFPQPSDTNIVDKNWDSITLADFLSACCNVCVKQWVRTESLWCAGTYGGGDIDCRNLPSSDEYWWHSPSAHLHGNNEDNTLWLKSTSCVSMATAQAMNLNKLCYSYEAAFCNGARVDYKRWSYTEMIDDDTECDTTTNCMCDDDMTRPGPAGDEWDAIPNGGPPNSGCL